MIDADKITGTELVEYILETMHDNHTSKVAIPVNLEGTKAYLICELQEDTGSYELTSSNPMEVH